MLASMFFLLLTPVGFALFVARTAGPRRTLALGYGLVSPAATVFYLAYYFTGSRVLHFGSLHYCQPWWPLWTIAAASAVLAGVPALVARSRAQPRARA